MSESCIRIDNVSKRYRLGQRVTPYGRLRRSIVEAVQGFPRAGGGMPTADHRDVLWALREVNLEIARGDVVAIIGRNGAGKTTLLRVLSRITRPTTGRIELRGRVGSLLEVGTGFHPELTGRENTYLNGAILGMKKAEIERKFDEIVAFAEVERFIDTPVKRYSSGMYVRLAFAVAAHLEPEVLLVDEVLAVGDAAFQKKCIGKMGEAGKLGRTVLFVSHNMAAVKALCGRGVLLREGRVVAVGETIDVVKQYQLESSAGSNAERCWPRSAIAPGNDRARLLGVRLRARDGTLRPDVDSQDAFDIEIDYETLVDGAAPRTSILVRNAEGACVLSSISNLDACRRGKSMRRGCYRSTCHLPGNFFADGQLSISVVVWGQDYSWSFQEDDALRIDVHETEGGVRGDFLKFMAGVVRPMLAWSTELVHG